MASEHKRHLRPLLEMTRLFAAEAFRTRDDREADRRVVHACSRGLLALTINSIAYAWANTGCDLAETLSRTEAGVLKAMAVTASKIVREREGWEPEPDAFHPYVEWRAFRDTVKEVMAGNQPVEALEDAFEGVRDL